MANHRYTVTVAYRTERRRTLSVFAGSEDEAREKACEVALRWDGVVEAEAEDCRKEWP